jgi:hypothetical protein
VGEPDESALVQTAKIDPSFGWKDNLTRLGSQVDIFQTAAMAQAPPGHAERSLH